MRLFVLAAASVALAAPALATTLEAVVAHGVIIEVQGTPYDVTYKADGTFTTDQGVEGTYKIDGDKLCITVPGVVDNDCTAYPEGKASGDSFEVTGGLGPSKVTIK
ncbi:hypothetical protein GC169_04285 [bacterium]|nr:hypothetical protein [bacterium]